MLAGFAVPAIWKARREPGAQFLLAWLIPSWVVFEAVMTKLPHYVLPLYPAIAILIAGILEGGGLSKARWLVRGTVGWFLFPVVIALTVVVGFIVLNRDLGLLAWPSAAAAVIFGLFAWWLYEVDGAERALLRSIAASVLVGITVYAVTFPAMPSLFPSELVAEAMHDDRLQDPACRRHRAFTRNRVWCSCSAPTRKFTNAAAAADFLNRGDCRFALIDRAQRAQFHPAGQRNRPALRA